MIGETTARLRAETATAHERLETDLDIFAHVRRPPDRRRLVERFHGLHAGVERALAPWLEQVAGLDFAGRSRLPHLRRDLTALHAALPAALPVCDVGPVGDRGEALGLLYVFEGSTLGGHVIRKRLAAEGQDADGLSFLDPYGAAVGERWRAFLAVLERQTADEAARASAVRGGRRGFDLAHGWLCAQAVAA